MKNPWKWVITGTALVTALFVVPVVVSLQLRSRAVGEAAATATSFLSALDSHNYAGAHALLDAPQQQAVTRSAMQRDEEEIEKKHGEPLGRSAVDEYHPNRDLTSVTFSCDNACQRGGGPIRVVVVKTRDGWRVSAYHYDFSPA